MQRLIHVSGSASLADAVPIAHHSLWMSCGPAELNAERGAYHFSLLVGLKVNGVTSDSTRAITVIIWWILAISGRPGALPT